MYVISYASLCREYESNALWMNKREKTVPTVKHCSSLTAAQVDVPSPAAGAAPTID